MDIEGYLQRINYEDSIAPTVKTLRKLHLAHLYSVPFENLDIHLGSPIVLKLDELYEKIVGRGRGGFCYELNGLFAWLLGELGFKVTLLSARAAHEDGSFGREFDHLVFQVECPADPSEPSVSWLADVGWGDTFRQPLRLDKPNSEQLEGVRAFRIEQTDGYHDLWQHNDDGQWKKQYRFTLRPWQFTDFEPMCQYHQTSPKSSFTQRRICTLATPNGRLTLSDQKLIITEHGQRKERTVSQDEYHSTLENWFGMRLKN
jgi:N-hydroxyarylamine O-acetyltransferase